MNKYRNLWHRDLTNPRPKFYENDAPAVATYNGVSVFKLWDNAFDFVFAGACIAQRAGAAKAREVIDDIFAGRASVSNEVAAHIRANGRKCKAYADSEEEGAK